MARLVQSNIRTLEGALVKLVAYASLVNSPVTTQMAASVLERYFVSAGIGKDAAILNDDGTVSEPKSEDAKPPVRSRTHLTPAMVQNAVAARFGVPADVMVGKRRDRDAVNARQVAMHLLRELTDMSLPGIGQIFGGRDHSTVIHACDRVKSQIPSDRELRNLIEELMVQMRRAGPRCEPRADGRRSLHGLNPCPNDLVETAYRFPRYAVFPLTPPTPHTNSGFHIRIPDPSTRPNRLNRDPEAENRHCKRRFRTLSRKVSGVIHISTGTFSESELGRQYASELQQLQNSDIVIIRPYY